MPREKIYAFHKKDTEILLGKLRILDEYQKGTLECYYCKDIITQDNVFGFLRINNDFVSICNKYKCSEQALREGER